MTADFDQYIPLLVGLAWLIGLGADASITLAHGHSRSDSDLLVY